MQLTRYTKEKLSPKNKPAGLKAPRPSWGLAEPASSSCLLPPGLRRWHLGKHSKVVSDSGNKTKMNGDMLNENQTNRRQFVQIVTCCKEAKLTVSGTSYAIWVDTPPMSRMPAVLFRMMALLFSLPGRLTSTTASSSAETGHTGGSGPDPEPGSSWGRFVFWGYVSRRRAALPLLPARLRLTVPAPALLLHTWPRHWPSSLLSSDHNFRSDPLAASQTLTLLNMLKSSKDKINADPRVHTYSQWTEQK